jgi:Leucine-rich repeat (LRR) protein
MVLSGTIPNELGDLPELTFLDLSWNRKLVGPIPASIGKLKELRMLMLDTSGLTGTIPMELTFLKNLNTLHLEQNALSGPIPHRLFAAFSAMNEVHLSENQLIGGTLPANIFGPKSQLNKLSLSNCRFSGTIPSSWSNWTALNNLDLSNNQLTGSIPTLPNCYYLYLANNSLSGTIPALSKSLGSLDLSRNKLTGEIPPMLSHLPYLSLLWLRGNEGLGGSYNLSKTIQTEGSYYCDLDQTAACWTGHNNSWGQAPCYGNRCNTG